MKMLRTLMMVAALAAAPMLAACGGEAVGSAGGVVRDVGPVAIEAGFERQFTGVEARIDKGEIATAEQAQAASADARSARARLAQGRAAGDLLAALFPPSPAAARALDAARDRTDAAYERLQERLGRIIIDAALASSG